METIPYMETFLIYQTVYYIKQGGFGNFFTVKSLNWKQFLVKITFFFIFIILKYDFVQPEWILNISYLL